MLTIPPHLASWYPNEPRSCFGTPAALFRDHRLTLPLIDLAARQGLLTTPVTLISFDRHRDSLAPGNGAGPLAEFRTSNGSPEALAELVAHHLSPRDDDWIPAGMELGLIGDAVLFSSNTEYADESPVAAYTDWSGDMHATYRLGRPISELSYKGALADPGHPAPVSGLWSRLGWDPAGTERPNPPYPLVTDIDLDYWTIAWETHTFPFTEQVFQAEWLTPGQSPSGETMTAAALVRRLIEVSVLCTIATEPQYCGGAEHASRILDMIDGPLFDGLFHRTGPLIDYPAPYPSS